MYRTRWLAAVILLAFGVFASLGATHAGAQNYDSTEMETVELINAYRQENGLAPLSLSAQLSVASAGTVSPEPQIAAPTSAEREIPAPSVEGTGAAGSAGQSEEASEVSSGQSEKPSEAMAAVGMVVLPDTGGPPLGSMLGAALVVCVLGGARRFMG